MESVENSGRMLDDPSWNGNWKDELGVAIGGGLLNSYGYNRLTDRGQEAAIEYLFGSRGFGSFVLQEALGQWSDPTIALPALVSAAGAGIGSFQTLSARLNASSGVNGLGVGEYARIQNAATRINKPINVVGSRASGTAKPTSDWDYVIEGLTNREWKKIKNSLPGAGSRIDNLPRAIDIFKGRVDPTKPFMTISPKR